MPISLLNSDKQRVLRGLVGLASDAAAVALKLGKYPFIAIRLLERGHNVMANSLEDMDVTILDLKENEEGLARDFTATANNKNPTVPLLSYRYCPAILLY